MFVLQEGANVCLLNYLGLVCLIIFSKFALSIVFTSGNIQNDH